MTAHLDPLSRNAIELVWSGIYALPTQHENEKYFRTHIDTYQKLPP